MEQRQPAQFRRIFVDIFVKGEPTYGSQRHLLLRPDLGQIEDVPAELLSLLKCKNLDINSPAGVVAFLNSLEEVLGVPVRDLGSQATGLVVSKSLAALVRLKVDLGVDEGAIRFSPLVSVARVAIHVAVGVGSTPVREQVHNLMDGLLVSGEIL
jgi:hypothetical protein